MFLHLGYGGRASRNPMFTGLRAITCDLDRRCRPQVCCTIERLPFADQSFDGITSSHVLEHLTPFGLVRCVHECFRVLRDDGIFTARVPDFEAACEWIASGRGRETVYVSPSGPITAMDLVYGFERITDDNPMMRHATGITVRDAFKMLADAGFVDVQVSRLRGAAMDLEIIGKKPATN